MSYGGSIIFWTGNDHVSTDARTLRELLRMIRAGKKAKAESLVEGILRRQRQKDARDRRELARLARLARKAKRQAGAR